MKMSRHLRHLLVLPLIAWCSATGHAAEGGESPAGARVLILTGEDYPGHVWSRTTPVLQTQLGRDTRLKIDVLQDLTLLETRDLTRYQAVVMHFKNYDPRVPGRAGFDRLDAYVRGGGGLVLVHFACGAFQEFKPDFAELAGRVWFGLTPPPGARQHDPYGPFTVHISESEHPITRHMRDFETRDELYTCLEGETPIHVLATAVSGVDGTPYPIAFVVRPGTGRVFHCVLGHDVQALASSGPGLLYRRGTAWAAGLMPANP